MDRRILYICDGFAAAEKKYTEIAERSKELLGKNAQTDRIGKQVLTPYAAVRFVGNKDNVDKSRFKCLMWEENSCDEILLEFLLGER